MGEQERLWVAADGTLYRVRIEYGGPGAVAFLFSRVCDGWSRSVPIHGSARLDRMSRDEIAELLREALDER